MELIFAGAGSAFTVGENNYHSNAILEKNGKKLLIDCGSDIRHSLHELGMSSKDIDAVYISHLHGDHVGGLEWLAFTTYLSGSNKPKLFISRELKKDLWDHVLSGGLSSVDEKKITLSTFFEVNSIGEENFFDWEGIHFELIKTNHVESCGSPCPSYGLFFSDGSANIFFTTDAKMDETFIPIYKKASLIFHDCETRNPPSGVHAHYKELKGLDNEIKQKMWLYHYNPGKLPDSVKEGFRGFVKKGQRFNLGHQ